MGKIYILVNASMPGLVKIGRTEREAEERALELKSASPKAGMSGKRWGAARVARRGDFFQSNDKPTPRIGCARFSIG